MKKTYGEKAFSAFNIAFMVAFSFIAIYPLWSVVVHSFNYAADSVKGGLWFFPRVFTIDNYRFILSNSSIVTGFMVSIGRTVIGTFSSVFLMSMFSYAVTRPNLIFKAFITRMVTFTMFFSGGMIPAYMLIRDLHLMNNFWVFIIPSLYTAYYIIIMRTYFEANIPQSLEEAAKIDGCHELAIYFRIIVPISMPILATMALFTAVAHWNDWFAGYIFISNNSLLPLQTILVKIINDAMAYTMISSTLGESGASAVSGEAVRNAVIVVVTMPIIIVYPFLQKYFVKGVLIGSVKE